MIAHRCFIDPSRAIVTWLSMLAGLGCVPLETQSVAQDIVIYDVYRRGLPTDELIVEGRGSLTEYQIRKKNLETNDWGEPVTSIQADLRKHDAFRLVGSISEFPQHLSSLSTIDWTGLKAVGWPDHENLYVRHRRLSADVNGLTATGYYWGAHDKSNPMDLVIGDDNAIIAAIDVANDIVAVRRGYEEFTIVGQWRKPEVSQPVYGYRALGLEMVQTRSGFNLATRVYLPDGDVEGPFPTILVRTPYGISGLVERYRHYAIRGYAVVLQAVRGTSFMDSDSRSEGSWEPMIHEPDDGADTLDWITAQPWSNGSICMQGASYFGYTQWAATITRNPALKCLVPEVSMGTAFSDQPYMGGTFIEGAAFYSLYMLNKKLLPGRTWVDVLRHRPLIDIDEYATGEDIPLWNNYFLHWRNDDYWEGQNWYAGGHERDFGTLQISGWFDDDYPGTRSNWALMQKHGSRPNRLLLGPWKHRYNEDRALNGYSFGIDALRDDIWLLKQKWYDYYLKGVENGIAEPAVEFFVLGDNIWRRADSWPPKGVEPQKWFLRSAGLANRHPSDGKLTRQASGGEEPPDRYAYDPSNPVTNWHSFDLMEQWADVQSFPYDFKDVETRHDVAIYTSAPFGESLTIAGNIKLVLFASADVKDTDWWAYISDVSPDNASNRLSVGVLRARFRQLDDTDYHVFGSNFETEELLSGDLRDVVRYEISIPSIANTFKKGHRIRLAVFNSLANYSFPNSNTGLDEGTVTTSVVGTMQIHHSRGHSSHVVLPVLPTSDGHTAKR